jgi:hypothetical protein
VGKSLREVPGSSRKPPRDQQWRRFPSGGLKLRHAVSKLFPPQPAARAEYIGAGATDPYFSRTVRVWVRRTGQLRADAGKALSIDSIAARRDMPDSRRPTKVYPALRKFELPSACDRVFPARENGEGTKLCLSCRLNRTNPDLSVAENGENWRCVELAKRRLISSRSH